MSEAETPGTDEVLRSIRADADEGKSASISEYLARAPKDSIEEVATAYVAAKRTRLGPGDEQTVAHYRPIRELGRGGQEVVWLAENTELTRRVALKLLKGVGPDAPRVIQRFRREA